MLAKSIVVSCGSTPREDPTPGDIVRVDSERSSGFRAETGDALAFATSLC